MKTYCYEGCDDGFQQENLIPASMSDLVIESIKQEFNEEVQDAIFKTSGKPASLKCQLPNHYGLLSIACKTILTRYKKDCALL